MFGLALVLSARVRHVSGRLSEMSRLPVRSVSSLLDSRGIGALWLSGRRAELGRQRSADVVRVL